MKKFFYAYLIQSDGNDPEKQHTIVESESCKALIYGVSTVEDGCKLAKTLTDKYELDKIELCGGFGEEGAKKVKEITGGKCRISYAKDV